MYRRISYSCAIALYLSLSTAAVASTAPPVSVPEPGMWSLLGLGTVGAIVVARFLRKK